MSQCACTTNTRHSFPPDVTFVADHAKRAISSFPVARGIYYGVDYGRERTFPGTRTSPSPRPTWSRNRNMISSAATIMSERRAWCTRRIVISRPGKKLWTWGNAEFGYAWDRNLTDADGPYIELMAGAFTDNQPDFSWLHPYETRTSANTGIRSSRSGQPRTPTPKRQSTSS